MSNIEMNRRAFLHLSGAAACVATLTVFGVPAASAAGTSCPTPFTYVARADVPTIWNDGHYISKGDKIRVTDVFSDGSCTAVYPTSSGSRTDSFWLYDLLPVEWWSRTSATYVATSKFNTFDTATSSSHSGSVAKDDVVRVLAKENGRYYVLYPVSGGYKLACAAGADCEAYLRKSDSSDMNTTSMTNALYQISSSSSAITCGFDGYINTKGRHEGIDFKRGYGSTVYSLVDGEVINVISGKNGSSGLSQISIYLAEQDKTVIYLHTAPSVSIGDHISRGQQIATEAYRGVSSKSSTHTHIEMREGYRKRAAKSVNDYTLENPDPTSFWNSLGYQVF